ncbi:ABC transporter E family member 2-like, partial [Olea europaea var. sylvestris]|uniref:ABC transporter E family member 2-like n=1 Tax=Olea europaea var. sylvestris TaxID=158386 RepID=UPI000C1D18FF
FEQAIVKPQCIEIIRNELKGNIQQIIDQNDERDVKEELCSHLQLNEIMDRNLEDLSSGEIQRLAIALAAMRNAEIYMFDEPSSYLDVKQRYKAAQVIRSLLRPNSYIFVVEHDLSMLEYLSDSICCLYGKPGGYGDLTLPYSAREGINIFLAGFSPIENRRIRDESLIFGVSLVFGVEEELYNDATSRLPDKPFQYPTFTGTRGNFKLEVIEGELDDDHIVVVLGESGIGKTMLLRMLIEWQTRFNASGSLEVTDGDITYFGDVSYKPQRIILKSQSTVRQLLHEEIPLRYSHHRFVSVVLEPLQVVQLMDQQVTNLSDNELQRVSLTLCLGQPADVYMIDELSAHLDSEQRIAAAKVIKSFMRNSMSNALVVESDLTMATYLADRVIVCEGQPSVECFANSQESLFDGLNRFLSHLDITFSRDPTSNRPSINKLDSTRDKAQKAAGTYYVLDD